MAFTEPDDARKELESLQDYKVVYEGNKTKAFLEWASEHADRLYPDLGSRDYVVPPIFVHKHITRYDQTAGADVLQETQKSSPKGEKAHSLVTRSFSMLSPQLEKPLFIISGLEYDNMLKWVRHHPDLSPALPDAVENRGDIDIMLIHLHHGVIFIQVKAVGDNAESRTHSEIQKKIIMGGKQLRKDENILRWVLHDWTEEATSCHVTRVVALPNLTHEELAEFWSPVSQEIPAEEAENMEGVCYLCKDDLPVSAGLATPEADTNTGPLMAWWQKHMAGVQGNLSLPLMKDIVSRYVGMLSAVEVYAGNNLRQEVRVTSDAVNTCGRMFRRILLNDKQMHILTRPCHRRYLSGPPGSGKTVILMLRARQFVQQGGHVIIVNMYRGAAGRAIGHFLQEGVARFHRPQVVRKGKNKKRDSEKTPPGHKKQHQPVHTARKPHDGSHVSNTSLSTGRKDESSPSRPESSPPCAKKLNSSPKRIGVAPLHGTTPVSANVLSSSSSSSRRNPRSPPSARVVQEIPVDFSGRVHSIDVDIDLPAFKSSSFENSIKECLPHDVSPDNIFFIVDEIYVKEYWNEVLNVLETGFPGCYIWCAGLYSRNPPEFEQQDLQDVLRCPPMVQKVLHAVDWDAGRRSCYRLNTDTSGVFSAGLTPLSVRHQGHPQVSITECELCAEQLSGLLTNGLKLDPTAPEDSNNRLTYSDVVMLVNIPRALYEPDERGFLDTTKPDFMFYMSYITRCPLVAALQRNSIPINVIQELPCLDLHDPKQLQVTVAWAYAYQGLENKIIIYLPGDTPWRPDTHGREIPAPGLCSTPRNKPKTWKATTTEELMSILNLQENGSQSPEESESGYDSNSIEAGGPETRIADRPRSDCPGVNLPAFWWKEEDIQRYSNWDKSNLFVAGSRCLSQLIMLIP